MNVAGLAHGVGGAARWQRDCRWPTTACPRRASRCRRAAAERAAARHHARQARAPALAAGGDDRAHAAVRRRLHRRSGCCSCRRVTGSASQRSPPCSSAGSRWPHPRCTWDGRPRVSRAEDVAALVAQPRGAAVHRLLRRGRGVRRAALVRLPGSAGIGGLTLLLGVAGVTASACIYRVPSRPAWNTRYTLAAVQPDGAAARTAVRRGASASATRAGSPSRPRRWPARSSCCWHCGSSACIASDSLELRGTARLLSTVLASTLIAARRAAGCSAASCCRSSSAGPPAAWLRRLGAGARASPARFSAAICSSSASCRSTWPRRISRWKRGRMNLKRLLGLDTRADATPTRSIRLPATSLRRRSRIAGSRPPAATARSGAACSSASRTAAPSACAATRIIR